MVGSYGSSRTGIVITQILVPERRDEMVDSLLLFGDTFLKKNLYIYIHSVRFGLLALPNYTYMYTYCEPLHPSNDDAN